MSQDGNHNNNMLVSGTGVLDLLILDVLGYVHPGYHSSIYRHPTYSHPYPRGAFFCFFLCFVFFFFSTYVS